MCWLSWDVMIYPCPNLYLSPSMNKRVRGVYSQYWRYDWYDHVKRDLPVWYLMPCGSSSLQSNLKGIFGADEKLGTIFINASKISGSWLGKKIIDHSDVVGAAHADAAQLHLHSRLNTWLQWIGERYLQDETINLLVLGFGMYYRFEVNLETIFARIVTLIIKQSHNFTYVTTAQLSWFV